MSKEQNASIFHWQSFFYFEISSVVNNTYKRLLESVLILSFMALKNEEFVLKWSYDTCYRIIIINKVYIELEGGQSPFDVGERKDLF